jgi:hypothetical protein
MKNIELDKIEFIHLLRGFDFKIIWIEGNWYTYTYLSLPNPASNIYSLRIRGNLITKVVNKYFNARSLRPKELIDLIEKQLEIDMEFPNLVNFVNFN